MILALFGGLGMLTEVTGVRLGRTLLSDAVAFALTLTCSEGEAGSNSTPNPTSTPTASDKSVRPTALFGFLLQFPSLGVFPRNVGCVVEVKQKAFAAIEESEAEHIVV